MFTMKVTNNNGNNNNNKPACINAYRNGNINSTGALKMLRPHIFYFIFFLFILFDEIHLFWNIYRGGWHLINKR